VESAIARKTIANDIRRLIETELERVRMYSERVGEVLSYLEDHPINVQSQKMFYVPTKELDSTRLPDVVEGLTSEDVVLERQKSGGRVNTDPKSKKEEHMADVTLAMLYLACGGMDEAHNIVLPYSWPSDTTFGGAAIQGSLAAKEAEYCHALVHRKEGDLTGELGAQGFYNCKFWFGKTGYHPLFETVKQEVLKMDPSKFAQSPTVKSFFDELSNGQSWHPDAFSDLCEVALESKDADIIDFCNKLSGREWKLLMDRCNVVVNPESLV